MKLNTISKNPTNIEQLCFFTKFLIVKDVYKDFFNVNLSLNDFAIPEI